MPAPALHPADAVLLAATPLVAVPRFSALPELAVGGKRFLGAADGVYVEARTDAWHVRVQIARTPLPFGAVTPLLRPSAGPIPREMLDRFIARARAACPNEIAAAVVLDPSAAGYRLIEPRIASASGAHVRYIDADIPDDALLLDLHSHGRADAFFSVTDDQSDRARRGPYVAVVVGRCHSDTPTLVARIALSPYLVSIPLTDVVADEVIR